MDSAALGDLRSFSTSPILSPQRRAFYEKLRLRFPVLTADAGFAQLIGDAAVVLRLS